MFAEERQSQILARLQASGKVTVEELTADFAVSAPTVRADLATLESRRLLVRTHGGAIAPPPHSQWEPPYSERATRQTGEKARIGRRAAELVSPGDTVILDAGTTAHAVGQALAASGKTDITVVTNNLPTAVLLMETPGITVVSVGGTVQPRRQAALGPLAVEFLKPIRADWLFMGVSGVQAQAGLTAADFEAAQVKQAMLAASARCVVVADTRKIGQTAFAHVAPVASVFCLITDAPLDFVQVQELHEAGLPTIEVAHD